MASSSFNISEITELIKPAKDYVDRCCSAMEPWEIILYSVITTVLLTWVKNFFMNNDVGDIGFTQSFLRWVRKLPVIKNSVEKKMENAARDVKEQLRKGLEDKEFLQKLPKHSWSKDTIMEEIEKYLGFGQFSWENGHVSGAVYHGSDEGLKNLVRDVYGKTAYHNPLHSDVFPGIRIMEAEIIRMVCSLFKGDKGACGTVTTGGTESIFLACKAYRDYARYEKGIKHPNMVIPVTAHAAFDKAAQILKIAVKHIPIDSSSTRVNANTMRKAVDKNTCMIVGSAPAFPHGCIDPIEDISKIGLKNNVPVHVDACLGGFIVPFMNKAGYTISPFDFSLPGVTSISVDTHKYAFAPKGSSVILYRNKSYRHYQYSVQPNWPGGIYGTPSVSGSRSGGVIATCWATLLYHGEDFYIEATRKILSVARHIENGLQDIPGIFVFGKPNVSVIAVGSKTFDIYRLSGALTDRGWSLNKLQFPSGFHLCVTLQHTKDIANKFLSDVRECTAEIMKNPGLPTEGTAAIYGMSQQIPDRSLVSELVWAFLDACYSTENDKIVNNNDN